MNRARAKTALVCLLFAGLGGGAGCPPPASNDIREPAAERDEAGWTDLLPDGREMASWRVIQGSATYQDGALILDGRKTDASVLARGVMLRDGTVEVEVLRAPPDSNAGPYTVGLRLPAEPFWQSIYFVCRPDNVETCRATWRAPCPPPEKKATFDATRRPEVWRFVMKGRNIHCYRLGRKVLSRTDPDPRAGSIGITASRCRIEIRSVRCRPAAGSP